jgi:hypothetical protein
MLAESFHKLQFILRKLMAILQCEIISIIVDSILKNREEAGAPASHRSTLAHLFCGSELCLSRLKSMSGIEMTKNHFRC